MRILFIVLGCCALSAARIVDLSDQLSKNGRYVNQDIYLKNDAGELRLLDLHDTKLEKKAAIEDLNFYFYTQKNKENPVLIKNNSVGTLADSKLFNPKSYVAVIIHGWQNTYLSDVNKLIKDAILRDQDVNIFVVDWSTLADRNYFTARYSVSTIGKLVAQFIDSIAKSYKKSYKEFTLIGHSLGAHVAGVAGSSVAETVDCIIGMDPAQPLFFSWDTKGSLDPTDADFVAVIHTSGGIVGVLSPLGHADYYPNGGELQPGCGIDLSCCHSRSYEYYAESVFDSIREFKAYKCDSYKDYEKGKCSEGYNLSIMGKLPVDKRANGTYYLQTNSKLPYAKDLCETH